MTVHGIDVSQWQGNIDFKKVKASGVKFVILRCNNWDNNLNCVVKDAYFESNYKKAKAAGLDVGVYYFTWQTDTSGAKYDADLCKKFIAGKQFEYPVYFDLEWNKAFAKGASVCSAMVDTFCSEMEKAGYFAGLYISRSPLQQYITANVAKKYTLWIAEYAGKCNYSGSYGMWQNSSTWKVSGINGNVDHDYCYVDYPSIIKNGGFNGFPKPKTETKPKVETKVETKAETKTESKTETKKTEEKKPLSEYERGDVNGDGKINITDVVQLAAHVKGKRPLKKD